MQGYICTLCWGIQALHCASFNTTFHILHNHKAVRILVPIFFTTCPTTFDMVRQSISRSGSSASALSCFEVTKQGRSNGSAAPSTTPPINMIGRASEPCIDVNKIKEVLEMNVRVRRVRPKAGTYNEAILSGSARRTPRRPSSKRGSRNVSGETLVPDSEILQTELGFNSIEASNLDWKVDALSVQNNPQDSPCTSEPLIRRKSTRLDMLERASILLEKTKTVLSKRGRETIEMGKEELQGLSEKTSLRPRKTDLTESNRDDFGNLAAKRRRTSTVIESSPSLPKSRLNNKPRAKIWLSQGLYVGQQRDFDARLTETKNKLKHGGKAAERQRSILPLPMFAGQRTLEIGRDFHLPFDVFSPLPPGQPKPEEWKKTRKSRLLGFRISS